MIQHIYKEFFIILF